MRWYWALSLAAAVLVARVVHAADDKSMEKLLVDTCVVNEASWIGKDGKSIAANCACKAKTEIAMATPAFRDSLLKKGIYDPLLIGDSYEYMARVLKDCPALRPLMIEAMCNDPTAPPDACAAVKDMVNKLK